MRTPEEIARARSIMAAVLAAKRGEGDQRILGEMEVAFDVLDWACGGNHGFSELLDDYEARINQAIGEAVAPFIRAMKN